MNKVNQTRVQQHFSGCGRSVQAQNIAVFHLYWEWFDCEIGHSYSDHSVLHRSPVALHQMYHSHILTSLMIEEGACGIALDSPKETGTEQFLLVKPCACCLFLFHTGKTRF